MSVPDAKPLNQLLKMAVMAGVESAIRIHIDRGDDLNARDGNGLTLLMLLAARNKSSTCKLLVDAGADKDLLAPSGKTAHAIAVLAGAYEAAAVLKSTTSPMGDFGAPVPRGALPFFELEGVLGGQGPGHSSHSSNVYSAKSELSLVAVQFNSENAFESNGEPDFDLLGWEPEEDQAPPEADLTVALAASAIQVAISGYTPIDSSADWEDTDTYLPERALPLARMGDAEIREKLRLLLLRAIREGSVPSFAIEELSLSDDHSPNCEAEALLRMVVNDLGAEADERFEYINANENFEVFVKPEEAPEEEELVADALAHFDSLVSYRSEPLRIYQREFQRLRLISAEEEVLLCQVMETGLGLALDALAAWPHGIALTLAAGSQVKTGRRPLWWLSPGVIEIQPDLESAATETSVPSMTASAQTENEELGEELEFDLAPVVDNHAEIFFEALDRLASLPVEPVQQGPNWRALRETLTSLQLNRRFLLELADIKEGGASESFARYVAAMKTYQHAHEQMVAANLKLVFHQAKKYLYSGEPLDDLAQEGNIGLLKAVERFDWRRGYKFSTYATWWIRQQIGRHVADKCRTIRLPVHTYDKRQRLFRETRAFAYENGREPDIDEIAARLGMSVKAVTALQSLAPEPLPMDDTPIDELVAIDIRSDLLPPDPFEIVAWSELRRTIDNMLSTLKPKNEQILRLRFGIGTKDSMTLEEVGQLYEVTRERVRQIEASAIKKLQHPSRADALSQAFFGAPLCKDGKGDQDCSEPIRAEHSPKPEPIPQAVEVNSASSAQNAKAPARSPSVDRLLAQVADLGIHVIDDREGTSRRIWVELIDARDSHGRRLVRKLFALGFEFWPGKGYWK